MKTAATGAIDSTSGAIGNFREKLRNKDGVDKGLTEDDDQGPIADLFPNCTVLFAVSYSNDGQNLLFYMTCLSLSHNHYY
jgi:hypothetical protein